MVDRSSIGRGGIGLGLTGVATSRGRGVDGLSRVGHVSNKAVGVVSVVGDGLDPAIGKVDRVRSRNNTGAIVGLRLLKVGLGVVIGHSVLVGVRLGRLLAFITLGQTDSQEGGGEDNLEMLLLASNYQDLTILWSSPATSSLFSEQETAGHWSRTSVLQHFIPISPSM